MILQKLIRGHSLTSLRYASRSVHTSRAWSTITKDMLLYSSEMDVYDMTIIRNEARWVEQEKIRLQEENERLRRSVENDEKTNFSVALPFVFDGVAWVTRTAQTDDIVEVQEPQLPGESPEDAKPIYPFGLAQDRLLFRERPELLHAGESDEDSESVSHQEDRQGPGGRRVKRSRRNKRDKDKQSVEFEVLDDELDPENAKKMLSRDEMFRYGSADPEEPSSDVPCGSCGALLHCMDPKLPGFTPAEVFKGKTVKQLRHVSCQRCYVLNEYNVALKLSVSPDYYPQTLKHLHTKRAIVLLMVDLLDFPGSVCPRILDLLGPNKRIILVGNKVDLLPQDSGNYLKRIEKSMKHNFLEKCKDSLITYDPKRISSILVSARTGYNIEPLINIIYASWSENKWKMGADIYLVGTTNVGKSSLFNQLLESDLCKVKALDCIEKAMTSTIPGTTLNLLKFPIMRPDPMRMNQRITRLHKEKEIFIREEKERIMNLRKYKDRKYAVPSAPVGLTFAYKADKHLPFTGGLFDLDKSIHRNLPKRLDPMDPDFAYGKWCYDTPGTVSEDQIINLLTQEEVRMMLPDLPIRPRSFTLKNGQSIFIAGLARFDLIKSPYWRHPMIVTVFCSDFLPINIVRTADAEQFYQKALGTEMFKVPTGSPLRLRDFPALEGKEFEVDGICEKEASCEVVLSSAGWITCVPRAGHMCRIKAWTPGGKGIYLRDPPFLPFAHLLRGMRIKGTCAYKNDKIFVPGTFMH